MSIPKTTLRLLVLSLLISLPLAANPEATSEPQLIAVKFHADWCGSCKKMGDVFSDLTNKFDGQPILFVTLDKTNLSQKHQSELLVAALGIQNAYEKNPGTGFILLLDAKTKSVVTKLTANQDIKAMGGEIKKLMGTS